MLITTIEKVITTYREMDPCHTRKVITSYMRNSGNYYLQKKTLLRKKVATTDRDME